MWCSGTAWLLSGSQQRPEHEGTGPAEALPQRVLTAALLAGSRGLGVGDRPPELGAGGPGSPCLQQGVKYHRPLALRFPAPRTRDTGWAASQRPGLDVHALRVCQRGHSCLLPVCPGTLRRGTLERGRICYIWANWLPFLFFFFFLVERFFCLRS